jgi:WD40 repeat protein
MLRSKILTLSTLLALSWLTVSVQGQDKAPAKDQHGDPLPEGAVARAGSVRWRHGGVAVFGAFLPDGKTVISAGDDKSIHLWEFPSGKEIRRFGDPIADDPAGFNTRIVYYGRGGAPVALTRDGKTIATTFEMNEVRVYDVATGKALPALKLEGGYRPSTVLAFSPDDKLLASLDYDSSIRIWDWAKAKEIRKFAGPGPNGNVFGGNQYMTWSPDGKYLATTHLELNGNMVVYSIKVWDPATGNELHNITTAQNGAALSPVFAPDSKTLVFTGYDSNITIIDVTTGKEVRKWQDPQRRYAQVMLFSKDGDKLYTRAQNDRSVREWDVANGKELRKLGAQTTQNPIRINGGVINPTMTLSPDGKMLVLGGTDSTLQFIDVASGKEAGEAAGYGAPMLAVHLSADGKEMFTTGNDGGLRKWDAATGKDHGQIATPAQALNTIITADGRVIAYQKVGQMGVYLVNVATGKEFAKVTPPQNDYYPSMLLSPDGKLLAVRWRQEQRVDLYEVPAVPADDGKAAPVVAVKPLHSFKVNTGQPQPGVAVIGPITIAPQTLLFSPDGKTLASYADPTTLGLWDTATGQRTGTMLMPERNPIQSGAFSLDGRCLALDMNDGTVTLYELATNQARRTYGKKVPPPKAGPGVVVSITPNSPYGQLSGNRVAFAPDGKTLVHAGLDRVVHVWDMETGAELTGFKGHAGALTAVAYAPNGKAVVSASMDTTALVWDMAKVERPAVKNKAVARGELEAHWKTLATDDAGKAFDAICALTASPKEAVALVKEQVQPAPQLDPKRVAELIEQLDSDQFKVRQKATGELLKMGDRVVPAIDKALAANPPLETKRRLEDLRGKLSGPVLQGEALRVYRAIELLERIGTAEARQALQALAEGAPGAFVTRTAKAGLGRLTQ